MIAQNLATRLEDLVAGADRAALADRFAQAEPFRHIVLDDVLPADLIDSTLAQYPGPEAPLWYQFRAGTENRKLQSRRFDGVGDTLKALLDFANAPAFLDFLEDVTQIPALIADTAYEGGGLHQTLPGGHLSMHVDYNLHPTHRWDRRLNAIFYLNPGWNDAWGGHLELWDPGVTQAVHRIAPVANRLVVFETHQTSWHGHPEPLACPPGVTRRSIATYYYTEGRPADQIAPEHGTRFKPRPGEVFRETPREKIGQIARALGLNRPK